MNRRRFVQSIGAALAAFSLPVVSLAQKALPSPIAEPQAIDCLYGYGLWTGEIGHYENVRFIESRPL